MQVAGTSGKVQQTADEDAEGISSDAHGAAITEALGVERRNEVRLHALRLPVRVSHHVLVGIPSMCCQCHMLPPQRPSPLRGEMRCSFMHHICLPVRHIVFW